MRWYTALLVSLLVAGLAFPGALRAQGIGSWERTDLFGNPNSLNNSSGYRNFLVQSNRVTLTSYASSIFGYWTQYDLAGRLNWRQRGRGNSGGFIDAPWRNGVFTFGSQPANNAIGFTTIYHWLNANGDTVHVLGRPTISVAQFPIHSFGQYGRYYIGGGGDGSGTGQQPLAMHYSLVCLDTAGRLRWQRQYPNPIIRLGPSAPAYAGGYAYLMQVAEAPRQRLLLFGHTQRDSANFQLYALETDTAGQLRRARWVEPFGRRAFVTMTNLTNLVRLRDGSGYVFTGVCQLDSLNRARTRGFVARLDTALRVVWRTLLPAPTRAGPADPTADTKPGQVRERADGGFAVLEYEQVANLHPRLRRNEFDVVRLTAQGRVVGWDTYCSLVCTYIEPQSWQYLPADSSIIVSGWGEQRDAYGRVVAQPAWLARFDAPCRRYVVPAQPTATAGPQAGSGGGLYPQPARAGQSIFLAGTALAASRLTAPLRLLDALGREVARLTPGTGPGDIEMRLPAGLPPGSYTLLGMPGSGPAIRGRLLIQAE
jgi:hypothetical protein